MDASTALAVVASPRRQEILRLLWGAERSAGDIREAMPDVTFGAVSHHLRALTDAGLLDCRRDHRYRYYRARPEVLGPVGRALEDMWNSALWRLKNQAELQASRRGPRPRRSHPRKAGA